MQVRQFSGGNCRTIRTDFKNGWWWCSHPFSSMFCYCPSTYVFQILTYLMMLRLAMKRKCELTPYKHNVSCRYSTPLPPHETKNSLSEILQNSNKTHIKLVSHLHEWQFFQLADKLKIWLFVLVFEMKVLDLRVIVNHLRLTIIIICYSHFVGWMKVFL
jgi:hypothetical protein